MEIGQEKTPEEYVANLVQVFQGVKRVLRDDGTLWLNLGDSFSNGGSGQNFSSEHGSTANSTCKEGGFGHIKSTLKAKDIGLKTKDLIGIPWMVAFALRADGWYLRQWCPWVKRNSMPESVQDRPSSSCETIFLLTKSEKYFYDSVAVRKPASEALLKQVLAGYNGESTKDFFAHEAQDASGTKGRIIAGMRKRIDKQRGHSRKHAGFNERWDQMSNEEQRACGSLRRNGDWFLDSFQGMITDDEAQPLALLVNASAYRGSHYATFPKNLVKPMILAGTSAHGCCSVCGAPWIRETETDVKGKRGTQPSQFRDPSGPQQSGIAAVTITTGWKQSCKCENTKPVPCTVLDCFGGSGTVAEVAIEYGRKAILCELDPNCQPLMKERCETTPGLPLS